MSLCINPICPKPDHPNNHKQHHCQSCGSDLLLQGRYRVIRLLSDNSGFGKIYWVNSVAISPNGQTLVSGSADKTIIIWNLATGNLIRTLEGHSYSVYSVAISPDGQTLVSASKDKTLKI